MLSRPLGRLIVAVVALAVVAGCGPSREAGDLPGEPVACVIDWQLVPATEVVVVGDLSQTEREMVDWALERFELANLRLPAQLAVSFDSTREACDGASGYCNPDSDPPEVFVCWPDGDSAFREVGREVTLLHEMAHMWHVGEKQAGRLTDPSPIVGGQSQTPGLAWAERSEERLAIVIAWGLMDQLRRPVPTRLECVALFTQFEILTGSAPLGPLEPVCRPPEVRP